MYTIYRESIMPYSAVYYARCPTHWRHARCPHTLTACCCFLCVDSGNVLIFCVWMSEGWCNMNCKYRTHTSYMLLASRTSPDNSEYIFLWHTLYVLYCYTRVLCVLTFSNQPVGTTRWSRSAHPKCTEVYAWTVNRVLISTIELSAASEEDEEKDWADPSTLAHSVRSTLDQLSTYHQQVIGNKH